MSVATRNLFDLLAEPEESVGIVKTAVTEKKRADKPIPLGKVKEEHHPDKNPRHRKPVHGREYDKRSGSGIKKEGAKKNSVGKGNWGVLGETGKDVKEKKLAEEVPETTENSPEEEKEVENLKTLDQYLSEKVSNVKISTSVRKANEGADESQWKDGVVLVKEKDDLVIGKAKNNIKKNKEKAAKVTLDIEQRFTEKKEGKMFDKGKKNVSFKKGLKQPALNVADSVAFPSLVGN